MNPGGVIRSPAARESRPGSDFVSYSVLVSESIFSSFVTDSSPRRPSSSSAHVIVSSRRNG